jgi:hypothetical protein
MKHCTQCGKRIPDNGRYCVHCGAGNDHDSAPGNLSAVIELLRPDGNGNSPNRFSGEFQERIARMPLDRIEQLGFQLFHLAMTMSVQAVMRGSVPQAPLLGTKPARSSTPVQHPPDKVADRLMHIHEASTIIGMSKSWIYHHWPELPFAHMTNGRVLFSYKGMMDYIDALRAARSPR